MRRIELRDLHPQFPQQLRALHAGADGQQKLGIVPGFFQVLKRPCVRTGDYGSLMVFIGSTPAARRAGTSAETIPMTKRAATTTT